MSFGVGVSVFTFGAQTFHEFRCWQLSVHNRSKHFMSFGVGSSVFTIGANIS